MLVDLTAESCDVFKSALTGSETTRRRSAPDPGCFRKSQRRDMSRGRVASTTHWGRVGKISSGRDQQTCYGPRVACFQATAASQGTCNNLTFGYGGQVDPETGKAAPGFGYYETIAGGAGAGPNWRGQSGVHVHITNTRITDPESLEKRYPCVLREFSIRRGSGGRGRNAGGDGCVRDIEFRRAVEVSVLSERRTVRPFGLDGGEAGQAGENVWVRRDEFGTREINLGAKNTCVMSKGDRIIIRSPGGGAYGSVGICS